MANKEEAIRSLKMNKAILQLYAEAHPNKLERIPVEIAMLFRLYIEKYIEPKQRLEYYDFMLASVEEFKKGV